MATVILSSCHFQDSGTNTRMEYWCYYIETEDDTNCQIQYPDLFRFGKNGITSGQMVSIDKFSNDGKPYGSLFVTYRYYDKSELTELEISICRTKGNGKCTVYFINEYLPPSGCDCVNEQTSEINDNFPVWVKENYEQHFVIEDNEVHHEVLSTSANAKTSI